MPRSLEILKNKLSGSPEASKSRKTNFRGVSKYVYHLWKSEQSKKTGGCTKILPSDTYTPRLLYAEKGLTEQQ